MELPRKDHQTQIRHRHPSHYEKLKMYRSQRGLNPDSKPHDHVLLLQCLNFFNWFVLAAFNVTMTAIEPLLVR